MAQGRGGGKLKHDALIPHKDERDPRMPQRLQMKLMLDVATFGVLRAQELPARRQIVEKRPHFDLRAGRLPAVAHRFDASSIDDDLGAGDRFGLAGGEAKTRDARDARERFATKPERGDRRQVASRADLAGGVAFQRKQRIIAIHPAAVIHHADQRDAAPPDTDLDLARPGVEAVLDQLFHDRCRPLHHLARGDLARQDFGQQTDVAHGFLNVDFRFPIAKEL